MILFLENYALDYTIKYEFQTIGEWVSIGLFLFKVFSQPCFGN